MQTLQQALQLMNDVLTAEQAARMADVVVTAAGHRSGRQVEEVFWRALARSPSADELTECVAFLERQTASHTRREPGSVSARERAVADLCHVMFNLNEFVYVD